MKIVFGLCGLAVVGGIIHHLFGGFRPFVHPVAALLVVGSTILLSLAHYSPGAVVNALKNALGQGPIAHGDAAKHAAVLSSARTFAIATGAVGFVLGIIHLMGNLRDPSRLGAGVAFTLMATLYALILSEFFLAPLINRLGARTEVP